MSKVKPIPDGYSSVTPYLHIKGAARAIDYYKSAFGAVEKVRMPGPGGQVMHAELQIGDSIVMLSDEQPQMGALSPQSIGGTPVGLLLYVQNVDEVVKKAVDAGAKLERPVKNEFYGDRTGSIRDPFGHYWHVATHVEDVAADEMAKRAAAMRQSAGAS
jgi:PhnB protein